MYFVVVIPLRRFSDGLEDDMPSDEAKLLAEIRDLLREGRAPGV